MGVFCFRMARWSGSTRWKWRPAFPLRFPQTKFGSSWRSRTTGCPEVRAVTDCHRVFILSLLKPVMILKVGCEISCSYSKGAFYLAQHLSVLSWVSFMILCPALPHSVMRLQINYNEEPVCVILCFCFTPQCVLAKCGCQQDISL